MSLVLPPGTLDCHAQCRNLNHGNTRSVRRRSKRAAQTPFPAGHAGFHHHGRGGNYCHSGSFTHLTCPDKSQKSGANPFALPKTWLWSSYLCWAWACTFCWTGFSGEKISSPHSFPHETPCRSFASIRFPFSRLLRTCKKVSPVTCMIS